tara:strand:+ start:22 stop:207 length:186 start_codon:yes stop_codon:yes gene_type:complete
MSIKHKIKIKDKSVFEDKAVSDDYKTGGAYKAMLKLFAQHRAESGKTSTPVSSTTQTKEKT